MTNETRRDLLQTLAELSEAAPDVRFGQLVTNLSYLARGLANESTWEVEDDELLAAAREHLAHWKSLNETQPQPGRQAG